MPIIKSAKKRMRVTEKATIRNSKTKRKLKSAVKLFNNNPSSELHANAQSRIDSALKKGVIHKNKAKRLKKRITKKAQSNSINLVNNKPKTKTTSKTTTKKMTKKPVKKTKE